MDKAENKYKDIINMKRPEPDPVRHPRMSVYNRAAQFAPFAALTGYEEAVDKTSQKKSSNENYEYTTEEVYSNDKHLI